MCVVSFTPNKQKAGKHARFIYRNEKVKTNFFNWSYVSLSIPPLILQSMHTKSWCCATLPTLAPWITLIESALLFQALLQATSRARLVRSHLGNLWSAQKSYQWHSPLSFSNRSNASRKGAPLSPQPRSPLTAPFWSWCKGHQDFKHTVTTTSTLYCHRVCSYRHNETCFSSRCNLRGFQANSSEKHKRRFASCYMLANAESLWSHSWAEESMIQVHHTPGVIFCVHHNERGMINTCNYDQSKTSRSPLFPLQIRLMGNT